MREEEGNALSSYAIISCMSILKNTLFLLIPPALAAFACLFFASASSASAARVQRVTYGGLPAYRISDGRTEAVVVPQIGRIMRYGRVGGGNVLWNTSERTWKPGTWKNYGGEKNWLAPQSSWAEFHGINEWPPDPALDGSPYIAKVFAPGVLEMRSRLSPGTGISLTIALSFDSGGDFVIRLSASKKSGPMVRAGLWSNAQVVPGAAIFLPVSPQSAYKAGYVSLIGRGVTTEAGPDMICIDPNIKNSFKIGVDSDAAAIVSVANGIAFLESTEKQPGEYPDGPETAGLPVELYVSGPPAPSYCELELLGPLVHAKAKASWSMTLHWSLHDVPQSGASAAQIAEMARCLLYGPSRGEASDAAARK